MDTIDTSVIPEKYPEHPKAVQKPSTSKKPGRFSWLMVVAGVILVSFLTLTVPHSYEILSRFEDPGTRWLGWFYAFGLEVGAAFAAFVVCERGISRWSRVLASIMLAAAISGSYLLNLSYYLGGGAAFEQAVGLAALLPGFIALLGGMLPGLTGRGGKMPEQLPDRAAVQNPGMPLPVPEKPAAGENALGEIPLSTENNSLQENAHQAEVMAGVVQKLAKLEELVQKLPPPLPAESQDLPEPRPQMAKTLAELGRKLQRREIKIAEYDKALAELLGTTRQPTENPFS